MPFRPHPKHTWRGIKATWAKMSKRRLYFSQSAHQRRMKLRFPRKAKPIK